jgi:hypothetical protein
MEKLYGLWTTEDTKREQERLTNARKIEFGETALKPAIARVLNAVIDQYKYKSLDELNAVLRLYNVKAYRGQEGSRLYNHRGLLYGALDAHGKSIGIPIKASAFDRKPTLSLLEWKFALNQPLLEGKSQRVRTSVDWTLATGTYDLSAFREVLEKERISAVFDRDKTGQLTRVFYVDHETKSVFEGDDLGIKYNAQAIGGKLTQEEGWKQEESLTQTLRPDLS